MTKEPMTPKEAYRLGYHIARRNYSADSLPNVELLSRQLNLGYEKAFAAGVQSYCNKWVNNPYHNRNWTKKHKTLAATAFRCGLKKVRTSQ